MSRFTISLHGGSASTNLVHYDDEPLQSGATNEPEFHELRGFTVAGGKLYVLNATGATGSILEFAPCSMFGTGTAWDYVTTFGNDPAQNLVHPFDLVVGWNGNVYVSNQSSKQSDASSATGNVITVYAGFTAISPGAYVETISGDPAFTQLRGLAFDGTTLYASDTGANVVQRLQNGAPPLSAIAVNEPDHLWYDGSRYLFIGSEDDGISVYDIQKGGTPTRFLDAKKATPAIASTAGFYLTTNHVYVADRKGNAINWYPVQAGSPPTTTGKGSTILATSDNPEFIWPNP